MALQNDAAETARGHVNASDAAEATPKPGRDCGRQMRRPNGASRHQTVVAASMFCVGFTRSQCNSGELDGTGVEAEIEPALELRFREMASARWAG